MSSEHVPSSYNDLIGEFFKVRRTPIYNRKPVCTLIGSLRFMPAINETIDRFTEADIWVPAPKKGEVVSSPDGYKILDVDGNTAPVDVEISYLVSLLNSDVAYIVNPGGYIGATSLVEACLARKFLIPILAREPLNPDLDKDGEYAQLWRDFCQSVPVCSTEEAIEKIKNPLDEIYKLRALEVDSPSYEDQWKYFIVTLPLSSDWMKHLGLGEIINWIDEAWHERIIPHYGPHTRFSEFDRWEDGHMIIFRPNSPGRQKELCVTPYDRLKLPPIE